MGQRGVDGAGDADRESRRRRLLESGDRGADVHQPAHGRVPLAQDLPEARCVVPRGNRTPPADGRTRAGRASSIRVRHAKLTWPHSSALGAGAGSRARRYKTRPATKEDEMATDLQTERGIVRVPTGTWRVDPAHSSIGFEIKHLMIATVRGRFTEFEGVVVVAEDVAESRASGVVKAASIDTGHPDRDAHLRSPDFFDVENYPEIRFES